MDSPVDGDGQQVEDGGGAAEDVDHRPHFAQLRAERPLLANLQAANEDKKLRHCSCLVVVRTVVSALSGCIFAREKNSIKRNYQLSGGYTYVLYHRVCSEKKPRLSGNPDYPNPD